VFRNPLETVSHPHERRRLRRLSAPAPAGPPQLFALDIKPHGMVLDPVIPRSTGFRKDHAQTKN